MHEKMRFLLVGDFHIPERADDIPNWILKTLDEECKNGIFDAVLCTGDLTDEKPIRELKRFGIVKCVKGNMDSLQLPEKETVVADGCVILLLHGTGIHPRGNIEQLDRIRKMENADIVVHGHTHRMSFEMLEHAGRPAIFINPGTATGVWGGSGESTAQTFVIMEIRDGTVFLRFFENGKIKEEVNLCIRKKR